MRVIAGEKRRLPLVAPKGMTTRPTSDQIKETLFNIIAPDLYDINFLDLFAGSGQIGIEALSRGAATATFVEQDKAALTCIETNLNKCGLSDVSTVYSTDVINALSRMRGQKFDMVFMDPPYNKNLEKDVLSQLMRLELLNDDAIVIVEASIDTDMSFATELGYTVSREKCYKTNKHVFLTV